MPIPPITPLTTQGFYNAIEEITTELDSQTDRGAAIVGAALLDDRLRQAIEASVDPSLSRLDRADLFNGPNAPIGTYSSRARVARALGLFGDDFLDDLKIIGRVRNRFAHHLDIREFRDPRIAELCSKLRGSQTVRVERDGTMTPVFKYESPEDARGVFIATVQIAVHFLFAMLSSKGVVADAGEDLDRGV